MSNPRIAFRLSSSRPHLEPPHGKPLIVHLVVNVEHWSFAEPMPRAIIPGPHGVESVPDVPNFSWVEYGLRCGMPRILRALEGRGMLASAALNAAVINVYPELAAALRDAGWEFIGHGFHQRALTGVPDEHAAIAQCLETIEKFAGHRPRGWLGPGLQETADTPDLLRREGVEYVCDWVVDDLPEWMTTEVGPMIAMPYSLDLNDSVLYAVERHSSREMHRRVMDTLDYLDKELPSEPRVLTLPVHPHLVGVPSRMLYFERILDALAGRNDTIFMTGSQIADWYKSVEPAPVG